VRGLNFLRARALLQAQYLISLAAAHPRTRTSRRRRSRPASGSPLGSLFGSPGRTPSACPAGSRATLLPSAPQERTDQRQASQGRRSSPAQNQQQRHQNATQCRGPFEDGLDGSDRGSLERPKAHEQQHNRRGAQKQPQHVRGSFRNPRQEARSHDMAPPPHLRNPLAAIPWPQSPGHNPLAAIPWPRSPGRDPLAAIPWPRSPGRDPLAAIPIGAPPFGLPPPRGNSD
jgi:hypothetical protein